MLVNGSVRRFCKEQNVPRSTFQGWLERKEDYLGLTKCGQRKHLADRSVDVAIPFGPALLTFMKDVRRDEQILTTARMIAWITAHHKRWLRAYLKAKRSGYNSLLRLLQRYGDTSLSHIINVDETAIYYDMPPRRTWAEVGKSSKVDKSQKHSDRLAAVLSISADVHGKPGDPIETKELPKYPQGHHYVVQDDAWMDARVWQHYLHYVLQPQLDVEQPSVLLADNLKCHVSEEAMEVLCTDLCCDFAPIPENSTGTCQALDAGVIGPLKAKLRTAWLKERPVFSTLFFAL
ncbi:hypothetical protein ACHHYP_20804, partial [Achlya hypogyna]